MSRQVSAIMLGVKDVDRAKRFYAEGLGCEIDQDFPGFVRCSLDEGSSMLAFYEWGGSGTGRRRLRGGIRVPRRLAPLHHRLPRHGGRRHANRRRLTNLSVLTSM